MSNYAELAFVPVIGIVILLLMIVIVFEALRRRRRNRIRAEAEGQILTGRIPLNYSEHVDRMSRSALIDGDFDYLDAIQDTRERAARLRFDGYMHGEKARREYGRASVKLLDCNPHDKNENPGAWALWNRGYCQGACIRDPKRYMDPRNAY